jgi:hypothetical protein
MTTTLRLLLLDTIVLAPSVFGTSAHAETVPVERPRLCGNQKPDPERRHYHESDEQIELTDSALNLWAVLACDKPDDRVTQEKIAEVRRAMITRWGISVEASSAALGVRLDIKAHEAEQRAYCTSTEKPAGTAHEIGHASALSRIAGCTKGPAVDWVMDEHPDAPQVWRLAVVMTCFTPQELTAFDARIAEREYDLQRMINITAWARCSLDLQALDRTKFVAELDKEALVTPRVRRVILENFDQTKAWTDKLTAAYKAQAAKSPDVQAVAFDAPAAASAAWIKRYNEVKADFDVVIDVERAAETGRRSSKGCAAKVRPVLARLLARSAPKSVTDAEALVADSFVNRTLRALAYCEDVEGNAAAAVCLRPPAATPPRRWPRSRRSRLPSRTRPGSAPVTPSTGAWTGKLERRTSRWPTSPPAIATSLR